MTPVDFVFAFGFSAFVYLIVACQVYAGFPPFYRAWAFMPDGAQVMALMRALWPAMIGLFVGMGAMVYTDAHPVAFALFGGAALLGGLRVRKDLRDTILVPLPWASNPWTVRWPMALFDVWTLGFAVGFALLMLYS